MLRNCWPCECEKKAPWYEPNLAYPDYKIDEFWGGFKVRQRYKFTLRERSVWLC